MPIDDPTDLTDLECWYRGDLGKTVASGRVTDWADQSGSGGGRDLSTSATTSTHPTETTVDGFDALDFDGTNDQIFNNAFTTDITSLTEYTVFVVIQHTSGNAGNVAKMRIPFTEVMDIDVQSDTTLRHDVSTTAGSSGFTDITLNQDLSWYVFKGSNSGTVEAENDSGDTASDPALGTMRTPIGRLNLGGDGGFFEGQILEFGFYSAELTGTDFTDLKDYLDDRYFNTGSTVAVGQATETDTGQAVTSEKQRDVGQAIETDTGQTVSPVTAATVAVGQATETDTGQAVDITKTVGVGQASETDTGQAVTSNAPSTVAVGQSSETDTGQEVTSQVNTRVTIVDAWTEVGTSITASPTFAVSSLTDGCLVARTSSAGGVLRTVTALSYGNQAMTLVDEESTTTGRDLHTALWVLDAAGLAAAVDTAFDITSDNTEATQFRLQAATYANVNQAGLTLDNFSVSATGGATPTPEALTTDNRGIAIIAAATNIGTSDDPDPDVTYSNLTERLESAGTQAYAGIADAATDGTDFTASTTYSDTSTGHMLGLSLSVAQGATAVGRADETDTAQAVSRTKQRDVGQSSETDTGQAVSISKGVNVGQALETDTGQAVTANAVGQVSVGQAVETDIGQAVTPTGPTTVAVGRADETDTAQAVSSGQDVTVAVGQATETDTAQEVVVLAVGEVAVGQATETDTAQGVFASVPVTKSVGQASEVDSADAVNLIGEDFIAIHEPWTLVSSSIDDTPSFAIASGLVRGMLVVRTASAGGTQREVTVVNYGGQEMTKVSEILTTSFRDLQTAIWVLNQDGIDAAVNDEFEILSDNTEATQFRLQAAVYSNVNQTDAVADSFTATASGGGQPTAEALATEDGGRVLLASGSNFGTSDDPDVKVTYSNLDERLETIGTQLYAGIADVKADGTNFTPSTTYTDTNVGHMIGLSFRIGVKTKGIGQAEETDTAQLVAAPRQRLVTQAAEVDTALTVTPSTGTNVPVGQAVETDSSQTVTPATPGLRAVGLASETDTALPATPRLSVSVLVGASSETDTAQSISTIRQRLIGTAAETDTARTIIGQESGIVTLEQRQKEAGAAQFGRDKLTDATKIEAMRLKRIRLMKEKQNEDLLALIPAMAKALLR